jgi:hypothetical protein
VSRDGRLVFVAKSARTFCYGFLGVLFPVYLAERGMDPPSATARERPCSPRPASS